MKNNKQYYLLYILILVISIHEINAQVMPTDTDGDGSLNISTLEHLKWLSISNDSWGLKYELDNDINAADTENWNGGKGFSPLGKYRNDFYGEFDGHNFTIDSLFINDTTITNVGFFGYLDSTHIENINLTNVNITGNYYCGGLIAYCHVSNVKNCSVTGYTNGTFNVGGLIGAMNEKCFLSNSQFMGTVIGLDDVGGLVGDNSNNSIIIDCNCEAIVQGEERVGGFVGENSFADIYNCYALSKVTGQNVVAGFVGSNFYGTTTRNYARSDIKGDSIVGGYIGYNTGVVCNSYCDGKVEGDVVLGGFLAYNDFGKVKQSFYNSDISIVSTTDGGIGINEAEMQNITTFINAGWNTRAVWEIDPLKNNSYPLFSKKYNNAPLSIEPIDNDNDGYKNISTIANLYWISTNSDSWELNFELDNDIDADSSIFWDYGRGLSPIGYYKEVFKGHFKGNGFTISNLYINRPDYSYAAMFGRMNGGRITYLNLDNVEIYGYYYSAGLCGINQSGVVKSCSVSGNITGDNNIFGGLVAWNYKGLITRSTSNATVTSNRFIGGLVGWNNMGEIKFCTSSSTINGVDYVGGLVGYNGEGIITNSAYKGNIFAHNYVGGFVGEISVASTIYNCFSEANITADSVVGGFVGYNRNSDSYIMNENYAKTNINATSIVGGFVGKNDAKILDAFAHSNINSSDYTGGFCSENLKNGIIENCYATGNFTVNTSNLGGFLQKNSLGIITNSFWDSEQTSINTSDGGTGLQTIEIKDSIILKNANWNFSKIWSINSTINNGYPNINFDISDTMNQVLPLKRGWNMISIYVETIYNEIDSLFAPIQDNLIIIKNGNGNIYYPLYDIDQIKNIDYYSAYLIYMKEADTLVIKGNIIDFETKYNLKQGWNMISYPKKIIMSIQTVFDSIIDDFIIIKNANGKIYYPFYNINTIKNLEVNQGYLIYMKNSVTFEYPKL